MTEPIFEPLRDYTFVEPREMSRRAEAIYNECRRRRTVRHFSNRPVEREIIENCLRAAGTAPSGANQQPWHFVVVTDPIVKLKIREAAEKEEHEFYHRRAPGEWLQTLAPLGTDEHKPFLEIAPYLIAIFAQRHGVAEDGSTVKHYYVSESVGIATGFLISALHRCGLVSLTHTPSPMRFLNDILGRPSNETPFLLLVVGYPAGDAVVPSIVKKNLNQFVSFL